MPDANPDIDIRLRDRRLRGRWLGAQIAADGDPFAPVLVFLHEGLGCVELWRGFPEALCRRVGLRGFAYDRTGYGKSDRWPRPPGTRYMEIEGDQILPEVLDAAGIGACLLIGHSDGGTVALNYASHQPPMLRGVVTIGAHVMNEERTVSSIRHARDAFVSGDLRSRLERYHGGNVDEAFWLWNNAWLAPGFEPMDAAIRLPRVRVPVLALQGEHDEDGTLLQLRRVSRGVSGRCDTRLLSDCGHGPHLQDEATTVEVIARFVSTLWRGPAATAGRIRLGAGARLAAGRRERGPGADGIVRARRGSHDLAAGGRRTDLAGATAAVDAARAALARLGHAQLRAWDAAIRAEIAVAAGRFAEAVARGAEGLRLAVAVGEPVSAMGALTRSSARSSPPGKWTRPARSSPSTGSSSPPIRGSGWPSRCCWRRRRPGELRPRRRTRPRPRSACGGSRRKRPTSWPGASWSRVTRRARSRRLRRRWRPPGRSACAGWPAACG